MPGTSARKLLRFLRRHARQLLLFRHRQEATRKSKFAKTSYTKPRLSPHRPGTTYSSRLYAERQSLFTSIRWQPIPLDPSGQILRQLRRFFPLSPKNFRPQNPRRRPKPEPPRSPATAWPMGNRALASSFLLRTAIHRFSAAQSTNLRDKIVRALQRRKKTTT